ERTVREVSAPASAGLGPLGGVLDGAERVQDPVLAAMANEQDARVVERGVAVGAAGRLLADVDGVGALARIPLRASERPRNHVLEPAEHRAPLGGLVGQPVTVVGLHRSPAPSALLFAHGSRWVESGADGRRTNYRARGRRDRAGAARAVGPGA